MSGADTEASTVPKNKNNKEPPTYCPSTVLQLERVPLFHPKN